MASNFLNKLLKLSEFQFLPLLNGDTYLSSKLMNITNDVCKAPTSVTGM